MSEDAGWEKSVAPYRLHRIVLVTRAPEAASDPDARDSAEAVDHRP